jgi:hypothetical protein
VKKDFFNTLLKGFAVLETAFQAVPMENLFLILRPAKEDDLGAPSAVKINQAPVQILQMGPQLEQLLKLLLELAGLELEGFHLLGNGGPSFRG